MTDQNRVAQHTPGPWRVDEDGQDVTAPDGELLSVAYTMNQDARACFANARLIAAAPDLLDALSELVRIIDSAGLLNLSRGVQLGATSWYVKATDRLERARLALADAERQAVNG